MEQTPVRYLRAITQVVDAGTSSRLSLAFRNFFYGLYMQLEERINRSEQWMIALATITDGMSFPTSVRHRVSVALLQLSIEHYQGIHTLIANDLMGAAFALFGSSAESVGDFHGL